MLVAIYIASVLTACDDHPHDDENGVAFAPTWQDSDDNGTIVNDILHWIYKADGTNVGAYHYASPAEMASQYYVLYQGDYRTLTVTNLVVPFTVNKIVNRTAVNRASDSNEEPIQISLNDPNSSPAHAHFAVTDFTYSGSGVKIEEQPLTRVLAELSVMIEGAPEGAQLSVTVIDAATGIYPTLKNADGVYGLATETMVHVLLPEAVATGGTLATNTIRLMPTASVNTNSHLKFVLTLPDGTESVSEAVAPIMKSSGKYTLTIKYSELRPNMIISVHNINNWSEGWIVNGEILNPNE